MDETKQPGIVVSHIFLEGAEFSHRSDALRVPPSTPPNVGDVDVSIQLGDFNKGVGGAVRIEVRTRPENNPTYSFRVAMIAIVEKADNEHNMEIMEYLRMSGAALLYPFLRETIASLTLRGRFGPIWLNPLNVKQATSRSASKKKRRSGRR